MEGKYKKALGLAIKAAKERMVNPKVRDLKERHLAILAARGKLASGHSRGLGGKKCGQ
jgi:hypothetical protein